MRFIIGPWNLKSQKTRTRWGLKDLSAGLEFKGQGQHDRYHLELTRLSGSTPEALFYWAREEILHYRVFPPHRMKAFVDSLDGRVKNGTNILQGIHVGPFRLQMADRVLDVFEGENHKERWAGFTYGTLQGHAERGIETFRVTWDKEFSQVFFLMEAWSKPGHWLTHLFKIWARRVQRKAGKEAIQFMEDKLKEIKRIEGGVG